LCFLLGFLFCAPLLLSLKRFFIRKAFNVKLASNGSIAYEHGEEWEMAKVTAHIFYFKEKLCGRPDPRATAAEKNQDLLSVEKLFKIKKFALRRGVWFKALNRIERGVLDLTMKYVDNVKSTKLAKVLTAIIQKLKQATESMVDRLMRTVGIALAQKSSSIAVGWGNVSAKSWASDLPFAAFLAVMHTSSDFRQH